MQAEMINLDGSRGEGGGQILRTALSLSLVTGRPFRIDQIRARRPKPGLLRQHLTAVAAAAEIGQARVSGAALGSRTLIFEPGRPRAADYRFAVGTAGSATLVLQTVLPALLVADRPSTLVLEGGTHNPFAPPYDFLADSFLPLLSRMGAGVTSSLARHGFYPAGGGRFEVRVAPGALVPLELLERGVPRVRRARALVAHLPASIGERELAVVRKRLGLAAGECRVEEVSTSPGPGNILLIELEAGSVTEVVTGFGEKRVSAERVAASACDEAEQLLRAAVPVGAHLADQLLLPLALAGGGRFYTVEPSGHTRTNIEVIERFLPVHVAVTAREGGAHLVEVLPVATGEETR